MNKYFKLRILVRKRLRTIVFSCIPRFFAALLFSFPLQSLLFWTQPAIEFCCTFFLNVHFVPTFLRSVLSLLFRYFRLRRHSFCTFHSTTLLDRPHNVIPIFDSIWKEKKIIISKCEYSKQGRRAGKERYFSPRPGVSLRKPTDWRRNFYDQKMYKIQKENFFSIFLTPGSGFSLSDFDSK